MKSIEGYPIKIPPSPDIVRSGHFLSAEMIGIGYPSSGRGFKSRHSIFGSDVAQMVEHQIGESRPIPPVRSAHFFRSDMKTPVDYHFQ